MFMINPPFVLFSSVDTDIVSHPSLLPLVAADSPNTLVFSLTGQVILNAV
jgi:hypothetical protein